MKRIDAYQDQRTGKPRIVLTSQTEIMQAQLSPNEQNLVVMNSKPLSTPYIYTRVDAKQRLIVVEKASNNIKAISLDTHKIEVKYPGNEEEPYSK